MCVCVVVCCGNWRWCVRALRTWRDGGVCRSAGAAAAARARRSVCVAPPRPRTHARTHTTTGATSSSRRVASHSCAHTPDYQQQQQHHHLDAYFSALPPALEGGTRHSPPRALARTRRLQKTTLQHTYSGGNRQSAMCVQEFDDSLSFAFRITYRVLLRSSS